MTQKRGGEPSNKEEQLRVTYKKKNGGRLQEGSRGGVRAQRGVVSLCEEVRSKARAKVWEKNGACAKKGGTKGGKSAGNFLGLLGDAFRVRQRGLVNARKRTQRRGVKVKERRGVPWRVAPREKRWGGPRLPV